MSRFSVVPEREACAVWNIYPDKIAGSIVEIDAGKSMRTARRWEKPRGGKAASEFLEYFRNIPMVMSLSSELAYTAILPFKVALHSDNRKDRIEFHGALRELVNRANLETRLLAAKALGVEDLDTVLFDARVVNLKMDGKDIAGWPQITGKKLEGNLHVMFAARPLFNELHAVLHSGKELFVTEESKAALMVLARHIKGSIRLLRAEPGLAEVLTLDYRHEPVFRKTPLDWLSPLSEIGGEWRLSCSAAADAIDAYRSGRTSKSVEKMFARVYASSEEDFSRVIRRAKLRGDTYFYGRDVLPFTLPFTDGDAKILEYPLAEILQELGFAESATLVPSAVLLPLLEFYYHRGDPEHHRALARQIHWIAP